MLDGVENSSATARPAPARDGSEAMDDCLRRLQQHRAMPQLIRARSGIAAGGLALRICIGSYMDTPDCAAEVNHRLRRALAQRIPLTIALTDSGHCGDAADASARLEAFCIRLRETLALSPADGELIGTSIRSHVVTLQAYLVITSTLGKGPRYVMLDCLQMRHHADRRVQAMSDANWLELWHRRLSGSRLQPVYGESVRSCCSLLADEKTASVLPALAMPVPAESAWFPVEFFLPDFTDARGHLEMPALRKSLRACLAANDRIAPHLYWASAAQRCDSKSNNRVAVLLTGIGDLIASRNMQAGDIHSLRWADGIVRAVQGELLHASREMAGSDDVLPSLLQSDPSAMWEDLEHRDKWSSRWRHTLQTEAVRHRNMLVLSPYSVLPRGDRCSPDFTDLLPVLGHADAISFCKMPAFANWTVDDYSRFHRRAWAVIRYGSQRQPIAAQA